MAFDVLRGGRDTDMPRPASLEAHEVGDAGYDGDGMDGSGSRSNGHHDTSANLVSGDRLSRLLLLVREAVMENEMSNAVFSELRDIRNKIASIEGMNVEFRHNKEMLQGLTGDLKEVKNIVTSELRFMSSTFDTRLTGLDARIQVLERERPIADLVKKWVMGAVGVVVLSVITALIAIVVPSITKSSTTTTTTSTSTQGANK